MAQDLVRAYHGRLPVTRVNIDYWAHWVVSIIALIASIGIPIWQRRVTNAEAIASKRNLLLQSILSAKSNIFASRWNCERVLNQFSDEIKPEQRATITAMMASRQELHDRFEALHREWSDYNDGKALREVEQALSDFDAMSSYAKDMAITSETFIKDLLHITGRRT